MAPTLLALTGRPVPAEIGVTQPVKVWGLLPHTGSESDGATTGCVIAGLALLVVTVVRQRRAPASIGPVRIGALESPGENAAAETTDALSAA